MPGKFCYMCGGDDWREGLCREHYMKKHPSLDLPRKIEIEKCSKCELVKIKGRQIKWNPKKFFSEKVGKKITIKETHKGKDFIYDITLTKKSGKEKVTETTQVRIHFDVKVCGVCGRRLGNYYEGILQLRGKFPKEIFSFIDEAVLRSTDKMVFYRIEQVKGGTDLYFGSQRFLKTLANQISKIYKIKLKETFKQSTHVDGVEVHRRIVLARFT